MSDTITSPNMNLSIPVTGVDPGPDWANNLNASLTLIDSHDHSPGKGVKVTPNGLNINADLPFNGNSATEVNMVEFVAQPSGPSVNYSIGTSGVDLYYTDGNGNVIQLTAGGGTAGTPGSITGLIPPASATYSGPTKTFVWESGVSTAANMDAASLIIRYPGSYPTPTGNYIAIEAPSSLATGYALTLPATLPSSNLPLNVNSSGVVYYGMAPTQQIFTVTGTQTGWALYSTSQISITAGAVYTNNSNSFTVAYSITTQNFFIVIGTGTLSGSTFTKSSGTGPSTITVNTSTHPAVAVATYTTPSGPTPLYLRVRGVGGGGGGGASGTGTATNGKLGGYTAIGPYGGGPGDPGSTGNGSPSIGSGVGVGGAPGNQWAGSPTIQIAGQYGGDAGMNTDTTGINMGGSGGSSYLGLAPPVISTNNTINTTGVTAIGYGAGGGGAAGRYASAVGGGGGSGGAYFEQIIGNPSATYYYVVGVGGAAGTMIGGTAPVGGGAGAAGVIIVDEYYQ